MDDAFGRVMPDTPENRAKRAEDEEKLARKAEEDRVAAEKAEAKRLRQCKRRGIPEDDCPPLHVEDIEAVEAMAGTSGAHG